MSDHYADHQPIPQGPRRAWRTRPQGPGRHVVLEHPIGQPAGVLWTNDADAIGFLDYGTPTSSTLGMDLAMGFQAAYASGVSSPTMVFDYWADMATQSVRAQDVKPSTDLMADMLHALEHGDTPETR